MVTNYHVVEGAITLSVTFVDDQTYEAELCGYDEPMDIALLKVSIGALSSETLSQISVVAIGDSEELAVGEQVVAIGNALGYGQSVTTGHRQRIGPHDQHGNKCFHIHPDGRSHQSWQ